MKKEMTKKEAEKLLKRKVCSFYECSGGTHGEGYDTIATAVFYIDKEDLFEKEKTELAYFMAFAAGCYREHLKQIASGTHKTYEDGLREAIEVVVSEDSDDFFGKEYRVSQKHFQREIIDKLQNKLDGLKDGK